MKVIILGDIHGRKNWKHQIGDPNKFDKVIFLGDYVDFKGERIDYELILENLLEIIEFQKQYPDKVIMLIGNHDVSYIYHPEYACSGFNRNALVFYQDAFMDAKLQASYQIGNIILTHAGISEGWFNLRTTQSELSKFTDTSLTISDKLNLMMESKSGRDILFACGMNRGGYSPYGGIIWADKSETAYGMLPGYHQVVGHTPVPKNTKIDDEEYENTSITYIDTLSKDVYILDI